MKPRFKRLTFMGYPGYGISTTGRVWSRVQRISLGYKRGSRTTLGKKWKLLKPSINPNGYPSVLLNQNGKSKRFAVHLLVLFAFVGPRPDGMIARHFPDRSPTNNNLTNLSWATPSRNMKDREYQGKPYQGEDVTTSVLTEKQVVQIREKYRKGEGNCRTLGKEFNVSSSNISMIINRKTWKHVE